MSYVNQDKLVTIYNLINKSYNLITPDLDYSSSKSLLDIISETIKEISKFCPDSIYCNYKEYFDSLLTFLLNCHSKTFYNDNYTMLEDSLSLCLEVLTDLTDHYKNEINICPACDELIIYSPSSDKNDLICPHCNSNSHTRKIIALLKKLGFHEAKEGTSVLAINLSDLIINWLTAICPQLNLKVISLTSDSLSTLIADKYDVIIAANINAKLVCTLKSSLNTDGYVIYTSQLEEDINNIFHLKALNNDYFEPEIIKSSGIVDTTPISILTNNAESNINIAESYVIDEDLCQHGPLVSVILPCYNHEKYVAAAIESVLNQSYKNIEFLIADDCSSDSTPEIMKRYSAHYAYEEYYKRNTGDPTSRLIAFAHGKYVALMHSDDWWHPDKIALQVQYMEAHPECDSCLTWARILEDSGQLKERVPFTQKNRTTAEWMQFFWLHGNALCNPSSLTKIDLFIKWYTPNYLHASNIRQLPDLFKWIDTLQIYNIHIICKDLTIMNYHNDGANSNTSLPNDINLIRSNIEFANIWYLIFRDMDWKFFLNNFRELLIRKDASTKEEALCEKYFFMLNARSPILNNNAFIYHSEIWGNANECFIEKYNYTQKDFWRDEAEKAFLAVVH